MRKKAGISTGQKRKSSRRQAQASLLEHWPIATQCEDKRGHVPHFRATKSLF